MLDAQAESQGLRTPTPDPRSPIPDPWRIASIVLWTVAALLITLLAMRFGMRLMGVRDDIALPGLIYAITGPLVSPFYRFFPASDRFDYYAVEFASLAAAGIVLALALAVYVVGLLIAHGMKGRRPDSAERLEPSTSAPGR